MKPEVYKFWDIPSVMLASVKAVVNKHEPAYIFLTNANSIRCEVDELVKKTGITVIYLRANEKNKVGPH
jgi:rRNA-processing protein FCF1